MQQKVAECSRMQQKIAECSKMQQNIAECSRIKQKIAECSRIRSRTQQNMQQNFRGGFRRFSHGASHGGISEGFPKGFSWRLAHGKRAERSWGISEGFPKVFSWRLAYGKRAERFPKGFPGFLGYAMSIFFYATHRLGSIGICSDNVRIFAHFSWEAMSVKCSLAKSPGDGPHWTEVMALGLW